MGKGYPAFGPQSWMLSDELVQGSPAGAYASFQMGSGREEAVEFS